MLLLAKSNDHVENFDLKYYHPEKFGLKDLVFEVRISNLKEMLEKRFTFGKLEDVFFRVYWIFPGKYEIEVHGLPRGFNQVKQELTGLIHARMDYVIPQRLDPKLRSYKLSKMKKKGGRGVSLKGIDLTQTRPVNEIHLSFDKKGKLTTFKSFSPAGVKTSKMEMNVKEWSHNKWIADSISVKMIQGVQVTTIDNQIVYSPINGIGFPKEVNVSTTHELTLGNDNKGKSNKRKISSSLSFTNYEVNTGKAQRYLTKLMGARK